MRPPNTSPAIAVASQPPTEPRLPVLFCWTRTRPIVPINKHAPQHSWVSAPASRNKARLGGRGVGVEPGAGTTESLLRTGVRSGTPTHDAVFRRGRMAMLPTRGETREAATAIHTDEDPGRSPSYRPATTDKLRIRPECDPTHASRRGPPYNRQRNARPREALPTVREVTRPAVEAAGPCGRATGRSAPRPSDLRADRRRRRCHRRAAYAGMSASPAGGTRLETP